MAAMPRFADPKVAQVFASFPAPARPGLLQLRQRILSVAAQTPGVGAVQETLKWNQPAYLTPQTGSGSTIRLGAPKDGGFAIYVHCRTTILSEFRDMFPDAFTYEGNRAIRFAPETALPDERLDILIRRALTYHL